MIHLEEYLDTLEALPMELQRQFTLMRELDALSQDIQDQMKQSTEEFVNSPPTKDDPKHLEYMRNFAQLFSTVLKHGEEKVALATQTYDLVDKHIRKLDDDLAKFEDRQLGIPRGIPHRWGGGGAVGALPAAESADDAGDRRAGTAGRREEGTPGARKNRKLQRDGSPQTNGKAATPGKRGRGGGAHAAAVAGTPRGAGAAINGSDARARGSAKPTPQIFADMPIDPNEPRYCYCQQVSYGEMVACDDEDCKIEWFHLDCVDLRAPPKGAWFCSDCSQKHKKHRNHS